MPKKLKQYIVRKRALRTVSPELDPVGRVNALTSVAKANWLGLLAYLAFVGVTLLGVEDADFFLTERRTDLPLIGVNIPTNLFFYIAPGLGAMLYIHMHLYLMKLWRALEEFPVASPSPEKRIVPWIVSDMALRRLQNSLNDHPLRGFTTTLVFLSIFAAGPIIMAAFWWWSLPKHDEILTVIFCGLPFFASLITMFESLRALRRGSLPKLIISRSRRFSWGVILSALSGIGWLATEGTLEAYARAESLLAWSFESYYSRQHRALVEEYYTIGRPELEERLSHITKWVEMHDGGNVEYLAHRELENRWWMQTPFPAFLVRADLRNVSFVQVPPDWLPHDEAEQVFRRTWCEDQGLSPLGCGLGPIVRPQLGYRTPNEWQQGQWCEATFGPEATHDFCTREFSNLNFGYSKAWHDARKAALNGLPKRDLSHADLRRADLSGAQLNGADLIGARMEGADLSNAQLERADLSDARMSFADLSGARMEWVDLTSAHMPEVNFTGAKIREGKLIGTRLEMANLTDVQMNNSNLSGALMERVNLDSAQMQGAILIGAKMYEAVLSDTRIEGTDLRGASMQWATLSETKLNEFTMLGEGNFYGVAVRLVDLSTARIHASLLNVVFGDGSTKLPSDIPQPTHWPTERLRADTFSSELEKWRDDPRTYLPPAQ